jgi:hypothetical protein
MHAARSLVLVGGALFGAWCALAGCGSGANGGFDGGPDGTGGSAGRHNAVDSGLHFGSDAAEQKLTIEPKNPTLVVTGPGATQKFTARYQGEIVTAAWSLDAAGTGTIASSGVFTASGLIGGTVGVIASYRGQSAETSLHIILKLTENPGKIDPGTRSKLEAGGSADPAFSWLYPYDETVFPRDLPAPTLQFATGPLSDAATTSFDAAMVKVTFAGLEYTGFYGPSTPLANQIPLSAKAWNAITLSATGTDAVKVDVTEISGGAVSGPIHETWTIATGSLSGSIFYNSYNSILAGSTGAVLKLRPSQQELTVVLSNSGGTVCHVCHAVAANGSRLEASNESAALSTDGVWDLTTDGGGAAPVYTPPDRTWDFGAFTPDGTKFLRYGAPPWTGGAWAPDVRGLGNSTTDVPTDLFDPTTGVSLGPTGLDVGPGGAPINMMMPSFSSDGTMVAFNHYDTGLGHTIAVMNFDDATNTFSGLRDVATLPTLFAGWPTFTPDDKFVFFAGGTNDEYSTMSDSPPTPPEPTGNIYIAQVSSATTALADALNGVRGGKSYLPFPDDPNLNFEPTILPVASGGYYWVVFTTRRNYGNTVNGNPFAGPGGAPSPRKKLWVAAIDIVPGKGGPTSAIDLTHPAFYLDGQELTPGNMRAFWALDPCLQKGKSCSAGYECCSGFCRETTGSDGGEVFSCVAPPSGCSEVGEKCTTASDCCGASAGVQCTNGFCAAPSPK